MSCADAGVFECRLSPTCMSLSRCVVFRCLLAFFCRVLVASCLFALVCVSSSCLPGTYQTNNVSDIVGIIVTPADDDAGIPAVVVYGVASCKNCPIGYYQAASGASDCVQCEQGKFSNTPGAYACPLCPSGRFSNT